jgi:hypothetical protein
MAQSDKRPTSGGRPPGGGGSRRRTPAPPVKKPFPWGVVAVSAVLGLLLVGILVYAATNQGAGFQSALKKADASVKGVKVYDGLKRTHVDGPVTYAQKPPVGGAHNAVPQQCQVYPSAIADEHAVHSLEHGAVWITYAPSLKAADVAKLKALVEGNPYRMLSPYEGQKKPIALQAWGRQVFVDSPSDKRVNEFLDAYTSGPQAPEQGAACSGTTETGPLKATAPKSSAAPSASPSA